MQFHVSSIIFRFSLSGDHDQKNQWGIELDLLRFRPNFNFFHFLVQCVLQFRLGCATPRWNALTPQITKIVSFFGYRPI